MVLARFYRRSSEVDDGSPVYRDKWTKMLSRREEIMKQYDEPQTPSPTSSSRKRHSMTKLFQQHLVFSVPRLRRRKNDPFGESKQADDDDDDIFDPVHDDIFDLVVPPESKQASFADDEDEPVVSPVKLFPEEIRQSEIRRPEFRQEEVSLQREEKPEELRSIPGIATIADLGPKINPKLCLSPPAAKRRRSSMALPDWWKQPEVRQEEVSLQREEKPEELRSVPLIATIADLGPKINPKLCPSPPSAKRRRSSTALPDWWKQCVAQDRIRQENKARRATWHAPNKAVSPEKLRRRTQLAKEVSSDFLLSGIYSAATESLSQSSLSSDASSFTDESSTTCSSSFQEAPSAPPALIVQPKKSLPPRRVSAVTLLKGRFHLEQVEESETEAEAVELPQTTKEIPQQEEIQNPVLQEKSLVAPPVSCTLAKSIVPDDRSSSLRAAVDWSTILAAIIMAMAFFMDMCWANF